MLLPTGQGLKQEISLKTELNTRGKTLFLSLSIASLVFLMALTWVFWLFISPRVNELSKIAAIITYTSLRLFFSIITLGLTLILLTCWKEKNFLVTRFAVKLSINFLFPVTIFIGKLIGFKKDAIRTSFVKVNNSFIKALNTTFSPERVLILLPHCLQNFECKLRITTNINNCADCGKCDIGNLIKLAKKYNVKIAIATGGTLARKIIIENRPKFIIAVACQRDLVDGIQDVFPIPTYGVLNDRPNGPCVSTRVAVERVENIIKKVIGLHQ